ncbi:MAG: hypothetical protein AAFV43_00980 [Planctomycetota bacterium]
MDLASLLAAAEPRFDGAYFLALLSRVAHTTCAATMLGGLVYLRFVLAPAAAEADDAAAVAYAGRRKTWASCVAVCTGLLLVSGVYNLLLYTSTYPGVPKLYHSLFGVKFLLALGVMAIAALLAGKTKLAGKMQASMKRWSGIGIKLALAVFVISAMLRSFRDLPGARDASSEDAPSFAGEAAPDIELIEPISPETTTE